MEFLEALEESLKELGIDNLDENPNDIPLGTDETAEDVESEDETRDSQPVEDDSNDEQDDEGDDSGPVLEIVEDAKLKLQDGTVVSAKEVLFRQADYTRKTQELAEARRVFDEEQADYLSSVNQIEQQFQQVSDWYNERASRPSEWIAEIASTSADPTSTLAKALYDLAQSGVLDKQFVESFGIESDMIRDRAEKHDVTAELEEIKAWRRQQEEESNRHTLVQQQIKRYEGEWQSIKGSRELSFESPAEELALKQDLLHFALENNMTRSLVDAYDLMTVRKPRVSKKQEQATPDVSDKKRASRAVTPKTAVSGQTKRTKKVVSDREAILEALEGISL